MSITRATLVAAAIFFACAANAQPPSWNAAQTEVWKAIEQSWVDDVAENGKWPKDYIHDAYVNWGDTSAAPQYADSAIKWNRFSDESSTVLMYEISPAAIVVVGDTAVAHYDLVSVTENYKGDRSREVGRITEILIRQGRNWKWLSGVNFQPKLND
ncbi:MAG: nuclear transport factor 2 family protein [Gammaproteobacteria bacterium]|nr:nuclear transport factor 2 family protein [Gammaproteobacteria bacterium]